MIRHGVDGSRCAFCRAIEHIYTLGLPRAEQDHRIEEAWDRYLRAAALRPLYRRKRGRRTFR